MTDPAAAPPNKLAIALQARAAMKEHRKGKPVVFDPGWRPPRAR